MPESTRRAGAVALNSYLGRPRGQADQKYTQLSKCRYSAGANYSSRAVGAVRTPGPLRADQGLERSLAFADNHRRRDREIHYRGRFGTAVAAIEHCIDRVCQPLLDLEPMYQRSLIARQDQRRAHYRFAELGQQHVGNRVIRDPHTDGAATLML